MNTLQLLSFGGALPQNKVTNNDLAKIVETSDEWIKSRTGIAERRFCAQGETKSCVNYMWKYKNEDNIQQKITSYNQLTEEQIVSSRYKSVFQYDINGNFLRSFDSALHVETTLGINRNP